MLWSIYKYIISLGMFKLVPGSCFSKITSSVILKVPDSCLSKTVFHTTSAHNHTRTKHSHLCNSDKMQLKWAQRVPHNIHICRCVSDGWGSRLFPSLFHVCPIKKCMMKVKVKLKININSISNTITIYTISLLYIYIPQM